MLVIGKTIGGGIPSAAYGFSRGGRATGSAASIAVEDSDVGGIGGTLAGYALSLAATRATLGEVLTDGGLRADDPARGALGGRRQRRRSRAHGVPWHVTRLGARAEYHFMPDPPRTGAEQWAHARSGARAVPPPVGDEPAHPDDAVPQHGADVAGHDRGRRRSPHRGLRARRSRRCSPPERHRAPSKARCSRRDSALGSSRTRCWRSVGASALRRTMARFASPTTRSSSARGARTVRRRSARGRPRQEQIASARAARAPPCRPRSRAGRSRRSAASDAPSPCSRPARRPRAAAARPGGAARRRRRPPSPRGSGARSGSPRTGRSRRSPSPSRLGHGHVQRTATRDRRAGTTAATVGACRRSTAARSTRPRTSSPISPAST